ncbi:MAG: peptidase, partial [Planctomycetota bacterium]
VMVGLGVLFGLEQTPELPDFELGSLNGPFINESINQALLGNYSRTTRPNEPIFPGNSDILHGQHLHRPESNDIDLYRFVVDLADSDRVGTLTAETFAERLTDASPLDSTLTLFQQEQSNITTDFNLGSDFEIVFTADQDTLPGREGNNARLDFVRTDRAVGDVAVRVTRTQTNALRVDVPRQNINGQPVVTVQQIVDAINNPAGYENAADFPPGQFVVRGEIVDGNPNADTGGVELNYGTLLLSGGDIVAITRNDDYFSEDSRLQADLGNGVYFIGVAASGNDNYDPTIPGTGFGGHTQGDYELQLKFQAQVDEVDVLRDLDNDRVGVPGTALDGDGDGVPGGEFQFWFQVRPDQRQIEFVADGSGIVDGQVVQIVGGNGGVTRTYEFVADGRLASPQNVPVAYQSGALVQASSPQLLADLLTNAILSRSGETGVTAVSNNGIVTLSGERSTKTGVFVGNTLVESFQGAIVHGRTIFVDKLASIQADGTLDSPFRNIANDANVVATAFGATSSGDIVRIVGNGGIDGSLATEEDAFAYQFGFGETAGRVLDDGVSMEVPEGVTVMVDAGTVFKLRNSLISVGSNNLLTDRNGGVLQVLGTPRLLDTGTDLADAADDLVLGDDGSVFFTSSRDRTIGQTTTSNAPAPEPGNWGGIVFRRDVDDGQGRPNLEDEGIFLQYVNHADIRYGGGGNLFVVGTQEIINPIQIIDTRPTVTFNRISQSADAAMSGAPNSFRETSFQEPEFQVAGQFTSDYDRVGPSIHNNVLFDNSINGLLIRIETPAAQTPRTLDVAGRFDDVSIVHVFTENLLIEGTPGGIIQDGVVPQFDLFNSQVTSGGTLASGEYVYRVTFVDSNGFESLASDESAVTNVPNFNSAILMEGLPPVPEGYTSRRLYRAPVVAGVTGQFTFVDRLDGTSTRYNDVGKTSDGVLDLTRVGRRGRLDASLVFDPGLVTKLAGSRLEVGQGAQILAEGLVGQEVVFTSRQDDRFGGGGAFDTNNDGTDTTPARGDWGGIYVSPTANLSLDNAVVAYGGGLTRIEGTFKAFNVVELQQGNARITNSTFEENANGLGGQG